MGHLKEICKYACRVAGAIQETSPSDIFGGQGADFVRGGDISYMGSFRFAIIILPDRRSTSNDLALLFRGRCRAWDRWGKSAKLIGTRPSALHSTKSRCCQLRILEEVSQNVFRFGAVTFHFLRKSRRLA